MEVPPLIGRAGQQARFSVYFPRARCTALTIMDGPCRDVTRLISTWRHLTT